MAIVRGSKPVSNFYILDKSISENPWMSWDERGLLVYLLGKPESWRVSVSHLVKQTQRSSKKVGKSRIYSMLSSLESLGYVARQEVRDENGKYCGVDYVISESPLTDLPLTDLPLTANQTLVSTDNSSSTDVDQTNNMSTNVDIVDSVEATSPSGDKKTCPWREILDIWREVMPDKPQPSVNLWADTQRARDLSNRWKSCFSIKHEVTREPLYTDVESGLEWWRRFFTYLRKSDFLMGRTAGVGKRAFTLKIDWVVKKSNFVKIMENTYHS